MRWSRFDLKSSIAGLWGRAARPSESVLENGIEEIRESMLSFLGEAGTKKFSHITRRIRYTTDINDLWYLRGDLMAALASLHGEATARERIASITAQFRGLLPGGLASRPSPLGD